MTVPALPRHEHYIEGCWLPPSDGGYLDSTNPATGEAWYETARGGPTDARRAVEAAATAFENPTWRDMSQPRRGALLRRVAELIGEHAEELARTESLDNGKLLTEMRAQLASLPEYFHFYAGLADKPHGETIPAARREVLNYTVREPLGVVVAITPWNSPLLLTATKIAPALAAGNTVVIKPSEHTSASLQQLVPLFEKAGFPPGVVNVVTGYGDEIGTALVEHPQVAKVSFTGSTATGSRIAASCSARFVPTTLELGGKSPNIVFADADIDHAVTGIVGGVFAAAGQTCVAGSRVFAHRSVYDDVVERVTRRAGAIRLGDPLHPETQLGPLAIESQRDRVEEYVRLGEAEGARITAGGRRPDAQSGLDGGFFFQPTVFVDAANSMRLCQEEIFGPVVAVLPFDTEDELIQQANATDYGLAAGVWTRDLSRAHRVASRLDAGTIWVNTYRSMSPMSPRSGFKSSGMGTEHGTEAMHEYTRLKSVWIDTSDAPPDDPFVLRS